MNECVNDTNKKTARRKHIGTRKKGPGEAKRDGM